MEIWWKTTNKTKEANDNQLKDTNGKVGKWLNSSLKSNNTRRNNENWKESGREYIQYIFKIESHISEYFFETSVIKSLREEQQQQKRLRKIYYTRDIIEENQGSRYQASCLKKI